jgi:hypothetical protein
MRKGLVVMLAVLLGFWFVGVAIAQDTGGGDATKRMFDDKLNSAKVKNFMGEVVSHDVRCHCFVVKGEKGSLTLQDDYTKFDQEYDRAKGLKIHAKVKGTYKTVDYINYALTLEYVK